MKGAILPRGLTRGYLPIVSVVILTFCVWIKLTPDMDLLAEGLLFPRSAMIYRVVAHLAACYSGLVLDGHTRASICILP